MPKTKKCIAPFPIFWSNLDSKGAAQKYLEMMGEPDTQDGRQRAYYSMVEHLRSIGELCEHPEHQPAHFKLQ